VSSIGRDTAWVNSHQPDIAEHRVRSKTSPFDICDAQIGTVTGFPSIKFFFFNCQYHSTNDLNSCSSICCSYKDKWAQPGSLPKSNVFFGTWKALASNVFLLLSDSLPKTEVCSFGTHLGRIEGGL